MRTMKNHRAFVAFRALTLAAAALGVAVLGVGCAVDTGSGDEGAEVIDVSEASEAHALGTCCDYGYWRCPSTSDYFDYGVASCPGERSSTQAKNSCEAACNVSCTNSGWIIVSPCDLTLGIDKPAQ